LSTLLGDDEHATDLPDRGADAENNAYAGRRTPGGDEEHARDSHEVVLGASAKAWPIFSITAGRLC
jgi:hypothetical protein